MPQTQKRPNRKIRGIQMDSRFPCMCVRVVHHVVKGVTQNSGDADNIRQAAGTLSDIMESRFEFPLIGEWLASISDTVLFKVYIR